jgi:hypothetical protein
VGGATTIRTDSIGSREGSGDPILERLRLLILAYHFPPSASVGAIRSAKFAKYLPLFGIDPLILAGPSCGSRFFDQARADRMKSFDKVEDLPRGLEIARVHGYDLAAIIRPLRELFSREGSEKNSSERSIDNSRESLNPGRELADAMKGESEGRVFSMLKRLLKELLLETPDPQILWGIPAYRAASHLIRTCKFDTILSTSHPFTSHIVALALKRRFGLRWIADFRDAWSDNPERAGQNFLSKSVNGALERKVLAEVDGIVAVNEAIAANLVRTPDRTGGDALTHTTSVRGFKYVVIPNGFDRSDAGFARQTGAVHEKGVRKLRLVHAGAIYDARDPRPLIEGMRRICERSPEIAREIEMTFIGKVAEKYSVEKSELPFNVKFERQLSRKDLLVRLAEADVLVIILPLEGNRQVEDWVPTKFFDALLLEKPVLVFAKEGVMTRIARESGGRAILNTDVKGIMETILKSHSDWRSGNLRANYSRDLFERYDRLKQARSLATFIRETSLS